MRTRSFIIFGIIGLVLIVALSITTFPAPKEHPIISQKKSQELSYLYIIKEQEGKIAVFEKDKKTPITVTDVFVDSLPEEDITQIKKGVYVKTKEELDTLLEDYLS